MKLGTFGAVISFALELEEQALVYYESLNNTLSPQLLKGSQKRLNRLRRIRQELVTEMILEPITDVDSDDYVVSIPAGTDEAEKLMGAVRLEENMGRYYSKSAPLIPMKEVERAFVRLAKENEMRVASINKLIASA